MPVFNIIVFFFILFGCSSYSLDQGGDPAKTLISLNISNQKVYINDSIILGSFMISPIAENHLWVFPHAMDLDLKTSTWTSLAAILGTGKYELRREFIKPDSIYSNIVWITMFHDGLARYDAQSHEFNLFTELKPVNVLRFTEKEVWVGTWAGLFRIDRGTNSIDTIQSMATLHIQSINFDDNQNLIVNRKYILQNTKPFSLSENPDTSTQELVSKMYSDLNIRKLGNGISVRKKGIPIVEINYSIYWPHLVFEKDFIWLHPEEQLFSLQRIDVSSGKLETFQTGYNFNLSIIKSDKERLWMSSGNEIMVVDKNNGEASILFLPMPELLSDLMVDDKYVYFSVKNKITIATKSSFLQSFRPLKEVNDEINNFQVDVVSLGLNQIDSFIPAYKSLLELRKKYSSSTNPKIQNLLKGIEVRVSEQFNYYGRGPDSLILNYADSVIEPDLRRRIYLAKAYELVLQGDLRQALTIVKEKELFLDGIDVNNLKNFQRIQLAVDSLYVIEKSNMTQDQKLWETGLIYYHLWYVVGPISEASSYIMTVPNQFLIQLIENYPKSPFADNAAWLMLSTDEGGSHEGGSSHHNLEYIDEYKKLLVQYPDTEWKPDIYLRMAMLYSEVYVKNGDNRVYLKEALGYYERVEHEFPFYTKMGYAQEGKREVQEHLMAVLWSLEIIADRTIYYHTEPVNITFQLTNQNDHELPFSQFLDTTFANFEISVTFKPNEKEYQHQYVNYIRYPQKMDLTQKDRMIGSNETYTETKNIKAWTKDHYNFPGYYNLDEPGYYCIIAFFKFGGGHYGVSSKEICITVN